MPAFPILRLGCTTIDPRQAHAYWAWAARNGQLPAACCVPPADPGGCWADAPTSAYTDPTTDCAAWVDLNYTESADFLGVWLTAVQGLDDNVTSRDSVQNVGGGTTPTAPVVSGRGIRIKGLLVASSCAGMEWGKQWWRRTLDEVCRWGGNTAAGACSTGVVSVRVFCPPDGGTETDGIRDLVNVSLASPPAYAPVDEIAEELACTCTRLAFEVVLQAGDPHLYRAPVDVIARTAFAGAFDYATLPCTPTPVTIPAEIACLAAAVPPAADEALPEYDDYGRPSCGSGSGNYGSRAEADFEDERGHPAAGDGSGFYLRTPGELPDVDWAGRPSCGVGSSTYSDWPSVPATSIAQATTTPNGSWAPLEFATTNLTFNETDIGSSVTLQFTGSAGTVYVRNVNVKLYASSPMRTPARYLVAQTIEFDPVALSGAYPITLPTLNAARLYGYLFDLEVTYEAFIPSTQTCTLTFSHAGLSGLAGPNGADNDCDAAVAGPNAGVDRAQRTECVSRLAALPDAWLAGTPGGGTLGEDHNGHPASMLLGFLEDEGDRFFGTVMPSGFGYCYVEGFDLSDICAGSTILWARLRAKFASPKGPGDSPHPWSIRAQDVISPGVVYGGRNQTLEEVDGTTELLYPLNATLAQLEQLAVIVNIAAPPGGTEGWLDYLALEVEYVGGPTCIDCGVNEGVDVPCTPAAATGCYTAPGTVALATGRFVTPTVAGAAPVITIEAGSVDLSDVAVFAWADPVNRAAPSASQAAFDFFRCVTPCMTGEVAWLPAGSTLTIDARARTVTLSVSGITVEASRYLTGPGGSAWTWPVWSGPVRAAVVAPATVDASARVTVAAAIAEGV